MFRRITRGKEGEFLGLSTEGDIPFNCVSKVGTEASYIQQVYEGLHLCGDGPFTKRCHEILESTLGVRKALLTTSCTHALEMAALLLDVKPGDEFIIPSFTFPSVGNAFVLRGAKPVFADIRPDTMNINEKQLASLITPKTRAIIPVHYAGVGCEMDEILTIADEHGLAVVEDNAHGLFGGYKGRKLGTFGCLATQSFHETKNFSCGEGGALLINHPAYIEAAEVIREKGTNRKQFFRGAVDKYTWKSAGSSYLISDLLAAILFAQLEVRESIQAKRRACWLRYCQDLSGWASEQGVQIPFVPSYCEQTYHIFYLVMPDYESRTALIEHLSRHRILSVFHYMPLHLSAMGKSFGGYDGQCPVAESTSDRLLRLPLYSALSELDQSRIIEAVLNFAVPRPKAFAAGAAESVGIRG